MFPFYLKALVTSFELNSLKRISLIRSIFGVFLSAELNLLIELNKSRTSCCDNFFNHLYRLSIFSFVSSVK